MSQKKPIVVSPKAHGKANPNMGKSRGRANPPETFGGANRHLDLKGAVSPTARANPNNKQMTMPMKGKMNPNDGMTMGGKTQGKIGRKGG